MGLLLALRESGLIILRLFRLYCLFYLSFSLPKAIYYLCLLLLLLCAMIDPYQETG